MVKLENKYWLDANSLTERAIIPICPTNVFLDNSSCLWCIRISSWVRFEWGPSLSVEMVKASYRQYCKTFVFLFVIRSSCIYARVSGAAI